MSLFDAAPYPWRYDSKTRNVIAADGSIVCRCGDEVYADPVIGESITRLANMAKARLNQCNAAVKQRDALRLALEGLKDAHASGYEICACDKCVAARAALELCKT